MKIKMEKKNNGPLDISIQVELFRFVAKFKCFCC